LQGQLKNQRILFGKNYGQINLFLDFGFIKTHVPTKKFDFPSLKFKPVPEVLSYVTEFKSVPSSLILCH
jgi:hypothetical protein